MKIRKKLALTLGMAAGAVVAVVATGRTGKRTRQYVFRKNMNFPSEPYDDSEVHYI